MTRIDDKVQKNSSDYLFICDFSPPKSSKNGVLNSALDITADFISVAYNPGRSVAINSLIAAYCLKSQFGKNVLFTLAARDYNILAAQSLIVSAELLGLENVILLQGDDFSDSELNYVTDIRDSTTTNLIRSIANLNNGIDYKGNEIESPTNLCIGSTLDLNKNIGAEAKLAHKKIAAGTNFFISQPNFYPHLIQNFKEAYFNKYDHEINVPIFHGIQVMTENSITFSSIPDWIESDLSKGRSGIDISLQILHELSSLDIKTFYLMPPIISGGARDYVSAQEVINVFTKQTH